MAVIGVDSHKDTLACCVVRSHGETIEHRWIPNTASGHAELVAWAQSTACRVGIEGSGNYGRPAAQALIAAGATVVEAPPADDRGGEARSAHPLQERRGGRG